uniref:ribosomal RNA large subunit methyltransferase E-like n=1 Tax=Styela clava TaxID=7725 RepID=UPI00193A757E|nr:ribosomal RNA large subunit methyltransferase E-like [Styela clava]
MTLIPLRKFVTSSIQLMKRGKRIPPKNFSDVHLKGTSQFILRQLNDPYVKRRRLENYRCRSVFKLLEIDDDHKILHPGSTIIDLGAAPGSWSQVASSRACENNQDGLVIAVDMKRFPPLDGVYSIIGDFTTVTVQNKIEDILRENGKSNKVDIVLCDAAPKASGVKTMDHDIIVKLAFSAAKFAVQQLKEEGTFLFKLLDGDKSVQLKQKIEVFFDTVQNIKPNASRKDSSEFFVLCKGFKLKNKI